MSWLTHNPSVPLQMSGEEMRLIQVVPGISHYLVGEDPEGGGSTVQIKAAGE